MRGELSRGKYVIRHKSYVADPDPSDEGLWFTYMNDLQSIAHDVYDNLEPIQMDTGLLDSSGDSIIRVIERNPIGFRANIEE